jgi:hypothetical protein
MGSVLCGVGVMGGFNALDPGDDDPAKAYLKSRNQNVAAGDIAGTGDLTPQQAYDQGVPVHRIKTAQMAPSAGQPSLRDETTKPIPQLTQYDAPAPTQDNYKSSFEVFKNPLIALAVLGSAFGKRGAINAMTFATNAMNGFQQGQTDQFEQNKKNFDEQIKAVAEQNKIESDRYKAAWDFKEEFDNKKFMDLYNASVHNDDPLVQSLFKSGKIKEAIQVIIAKEKANEQIERATEIAKIRADIAAEQKYGPESQQGQTAKSIVDDMETGKQPPTTQGLYGLAPAVRAEAARRHFDLARAQTEWLRAQTHMRSLSGPNMTKYFSLAESVQNTIGEVLDLSRQLNLGKYPAKNRADLVWLTQAKGGTTEGNLAVRYLGAIKTLKEEFANLAQGGGVPTEPAWSLANEQINQDFGVSALDASLKEVQRLIGFRVQAILTVGNQPYNPAGTPAQPAAPATEAPVIRYDSSGNRVQ